MVTKQKIKAAANTARARGERTRQAILKTAVDIASAEGLEGLTIGRLATKLSLSKSGLFAHFGSKEDLQLATVDAARAIFIREVIHPTIRGLQSDGTPYTGFLYAGLMIAALSQVSFVIGLGSSCSQPLFAKRPSNTDGSFLKEISRPVDARAEG